LGKISNALNKYAKERKEARIVRLTRPDVDALLRYDRETGHLLQYNAQTGEVDIPSMEVLRNKGTIHRLLDNKLIFPSGILTERGLHECERLAKLMQVSEPSAPVPDTIVESDAEKVEPPHIVADIEKDTLRQPREKSGKAPALQQPQVEELRVIEPAREEAPLRTQNQEPLKVTLPQRPQPGEAPPVEPDRAAEAPVEISQKPVPPEADMFVSADGASERDAAEKPQTIPPAVPAPQAEYDESALDKKLISLLDPQSYEAEQFKKLRTNILFPISGTAPQTIPVTTAVPAEGKSFVAANLAISIAMNVNKNVLLIDCDLRKPDIHRRFGFGDVRGLSDYLNDHTDLASLLLKTHVEKLTILPAGTIPPNPSEIMSSEKMVELLEEVKFRYHDRLIVIDSPPPAMADETSFLARLVDGIVVVARFGETSREDIEGLIETVGSEKIIGSVLNLMDTRSSSYYGYKKYGKYGRRYGR